MMVLMLTMIKIEMIMQKTCKNIKELPLDGYTRAEDLILFLPFGKSTLFKWSGDGRFPKSVKLSNTITAWSNRKIHAWFDMLENQENNNTTFEEGFLCAKNKGGMKENPYPLGLNSFLDIKHNIWESGFREYNQ